MTPQSPGRGFESDSCGWGLLGLAVLETKDRRYIEGSNKKVLDLINRGFWLDIENG